MTRRPTLPTLSALLTLPLALLSACDSASGPASSPPGADADAVAAQDTTASSADTSVDTEIPDEPRELTNGAVGRVTHIIDGDTLYVLIGSVAPERYKIRLQGINAPECIKKDVKTELGDWLQSCALDEEFYGLAAYEGMMELASGKDVRITCDGAAPGHWCPKDIYDRYLAYLEIDGQDVATQMAWRGLAWSYTSFESSKRAPICAAEYDARDKDRGMWAYGSVEEVIKRMSGQTQNWYLRWHDKDCDKALGR